MVASEAWSRAPLAAERGIHVTTTGYETTPIIELTALILASARHLDRAAGSVRDGGWQTEVLQAHRIAGAALDVFDAESLPAGHPFRTLDNVLATPHIGSSRGGA
jgi:phosphoglycerate dehydrogenase-like enzyme